MGANISNLTNKIEMFIKRENLVMNVFFFFFKKLFFFDNDQTTVEAK